MPTELSPENEHTLRRLLVSLQASAGRLDLFVAICDDRNVQEAVIERYEATLQERGLTPYRVRLSPKRPSLRASLEALVTQNAQTLHQQAAVVTVLGGNELLGVRLSDEKSEQEKFFFSLQWTREALREFRIPVVVWLSDAVATGVAQRAPDFWSWRSGVFEFESSTPSIPTPEFLSDSRTFQPPPDPDALTAPAITERIQQITEIQHQNPQSPLLVTLYNDLGDAYSNAYAQELALKAYEKAIDLAQQLKDKAGMARALHNAGAALADSGRYEKAIAFYQQSLELVREIGDRNGEATALNSLGNVYTSLGQYERAIAFHQQSLEIKRVISDRWGEGASLFNLGSALAKLDQHYEAAQSFQQALAIYKELKLDHMVEKCEKAIAERNQIIAAQRKVAPTVGDERRREADWWEKSLPTSTPPRQPTGQSNRFWLWFLLGLILVVLIWRLF